MVTIEALKKTSLLNYNEAKSNLEKKDTPSEKKEDRKHTNKTIWVKAVDKKQAGIETVVVTLWQDAHTGNTMHIWRQCCHTQVSWIIPFPVLTFLCYGVFLLLLFCSLSLLCQL